MIKTIVDILSIASLIIGVANLFTFFVLVLLGIFSTVALTVMMSSFMIFVILDDISMKMKKSRGDNI